MSTAGESSLTTAQTVRNPDEIENPSRIPSQPRRRLRFWAGILLLGLILLLLASWGYHAASASGRLDTILDRLNAESPDWRFSLMMSTFPVPQRATNAAVQVMTVRAMLPQGRPEPKPQESVEALDFRSPPGHLDPALAEALRNEHDAIPEDVVGEARRLAELPQGRYADSMANGRPVVKPSHVEAIRSVAELLDADVILMIEKGRTAEAMKSVRALLNLGRSVGDEPSLPSQSIRMELRSHVRRALEFALARFETDPETLATLQRELADESRHPTLRLALFAERTVLDEYFVALEENDPLRLPDGLGDPAWSQAADSSLGQLNWALKIGWWMENHARMLEVLTRAIAIAEGPLERQDEGYTGLLQSLHRDESGTFSHWRWEPSQRLIAAVLATPRAFLRSRAELVIAETALACERFRRDRGTWPSTLESLVPAYLDRLPIDPFAGGPVRGHRVEGGFVVYSLDLDRKDDGGRRPSSQADVGHGSDLVFALVDPDRRGP